MSRRQSLNAAYPRNDLVFESDSSFGDDMINDPQRAVVEGRVSPYEERTAFLIAEFLPDQSLIDDSPLVVPCLDGLTSYDGACRSRDRIGGLDWSYMTYS